MDRYSGNDPATGCGLMIVSGTIILIIVAVVVILVAMGYIG